MFTHYRTQGLIIKKVDRGEADQLFTIYTKDFGKIEVLGRAIRKINSKLRGGMELFYLSEIEFIQGKTYKTLTDAILINNFPNISNIPPSCTRASANAKRASFSSLSSLELRPGSMGQEETLVSSPRGREEVAYKISEVLDDLIKGQESDENIWQLLNEVFQRLDSSALVSKTYILYYYFFWNFVSILGYQPELKNFSICEEKISIDVFKILRIILEKDLKTLLKLKLELIHQKSLKNISQKYFDYLLNEIN